MAPLIIIGALTVFGLICIIGVQEQKILHQQKVLDWCNQREVFVRPLYHAVRGAVPDFDKLHTVGRTTYGDFGRRGPHWDDAMGRLEREQREIVAFVTPLAILDKAASDLEAFERAHPIPPQKAFAC